MFRQRLRSIFAVAICGLFGANAHAGYIIVEGTVTQVTNTQGNGSTFKVKVSGGSGPCAGALWIEFPLSASPDADTHKRAYAAALLAFAMGLRVTIHNYTGDSCNGASYINIYH